jgi:starch synthase
MYPYYARGLEGVISSVSDHFGGILCGIDTNQYDPGTDPLLRRNYTSSALEQRKENKSFLQLAHRLDISDETAIVAFVGDLVSGNGIDLIISTFDDIMKCDLQFVVLGIGDYDYEKFFRTAEKRFPGRVSANIMNSDELARRIYAGADILLMPSRKEPCGKNQMIAMRYGMLPVVRETGGLKDTVKPYDPKTGEGNGFTFSDYNAYDMLEAISDAIRLRKENPACWKKMVANNMETDFSWRRSALEYMKIYEDLVKKFDR